MAAAGRSRSRPKSSASRRSRASQRDVDEGRKEGLSSDERDELRRLRREVKLAEERAILTGRGLLASESMTR